VERNLLIALAVLVYAIAWAVALPGAYQYNHLYSDPTRSRIKQHIFAIGTAFLWWVSLLIMISTYRPAPRRAL
jgi:hypothetical protein